MQLDLASIVLTVTYPDGYPDQRPVLSITLSHDAPKPDHLALPEDAPELLSSLEETIEESLGAAMIFTLISTLKESAEALISSRVAAIQKEAEKEAAKAEEAENVKFHGEAVTRESFLAWRQNFVEEQEVQEAEEKRMEEEAGAKGRKVVKEEHRMTGRELWEKGLVGKIDEEDEVGEDEVRLAFRPHPSESVESSSGTTLNSSTSTTTLETEQ